MTGARPRTRWIALLTLTLPVVATLQTAPAVADADASYRGYLAQTAAGPRYVAVDASTGATVFTSSRTTTDGSLGNATAAGPTVAWVSTEPATGGSVQRLHLARGAVDSVLYTAPVGARVSEPALSADEAQVAFVVGSATTSSVVAVDLGSRTARTVRRATGTTYAAPVFSPDGRYLAWVQDTAAEWAVVTALASSGADGVPVIGSGHGLGTIEDIAWSPDGTRLATRYRQYLEDSREVTGVHVMSLSAGSNLAIAAGGSIVDGVTTSYVDPTWSSNGQLLLTQVRTTADGTARSLVTVGATGRTAPQPVPAEGYLGSPSASRPAAAVDTTPPSRWGTIWEPEVSGASARISFSGGIDPEGADLADVIVTRVVGPAADTPTAAITVGRTRRSLDVALPAPDTDYGISLFARDWSGNLAPAAKLQVRSPHRTSMSLARTPEPLPYGAAVRLTGTLSSLAVGQPASLWVRRGGTSTPLLVATARTVSGGIYAFSYTPQWSAEYQVRYAGNRFDFPSVSDRRVVSVTPLVSLALSASRTGVGRAVTLAGGVRPSHGGQLVSVQRWSGGVWRTIASTRLSSTSQYRYALKPGSRGTWTLRVVKPADRDHVAAYSPTRTLYVG